MKRTGQRHPPLAVAESDSGDHMHAAFPPLPDDFGPHLWNTASYGDMWTGVSGGIPDDAYGRGWEELALFDPAPDCRSGDVAVLPWTRRRATGSVPAMNHPKQLDSKE